jgi:ribose 1,5-bisphosphokinase PhnN
MENNKQQTAVEWYVNQLNRVVSNTTDALSHNHKELLEQAKKMEKELTINFSEDWYFNGPLLGEGIDVKNTIEQHFNETYGGGEQ